jgi:subtilisin family serine protease
LFILEDIMRFARWSAYAFILGFALSAGGPDSLGRGATVRGAPNNVPELIEGMRSSDVAAQPACVAVSAAAALANATGAGVRVAILDGGFDFRHELLAGRLGAQFDALDVDAQAQDLGNGVDDDADGLKDGFVGHGTFVAGLVATCAPGAVILPIRVLDDEGRGNPEALARGVDAAVALGADVINMSLVSTTTNLHLQLALQTAVSAGVVLVSAAGDDPCGPFNAQYVRERTIQVGAVDSSLVRAAFSPGSSIVDVFAPGVDVLGPLGGAVDDSYAKWSGTSFSAPFVSAAAALVREDYPSMSVSAMRTRLASATNAVSGQTDGAVDLLKAVTAQ